MFLELSRTSPLSGSNLSNDLLETATVSACCGFCQSCRNCCHRKTSEEMGCAIEMPHSMRIQAHQTGTGEVRGHGIVGENDLPEMSMTSVKWPVPLHGNDAVRDDEVHRRRRADIKDAPVDALPMQNILGPAILCARHDTKHVFHAQRNASPVVGFNLRHRHHEVGCKHSPR